MKNVIIDKYSGGFFLRCLPNGRNLCYHKEKEQEVPRAF